MTAIRLSFIHMIKYLKKDKMLFIASFSPLLIGLVFKFGVTSLESILTDSLNKESVISPYYSLFDIIFSMLSPTMFCFIAAMVCLEERDDKTAIYLFTTPLRKTGYLFSRLGIPALLSFIVTIILLPIIKLSNISPGQIILLSIFGTIQGIIVSLIIMSISSNKLEGMAISKISTFTLFTSFIPFFMKNNYKYFFGIFPPFWVGLSIQNNSIIYMLIAFILSGLWLIILLRLFLKKIK